MPNKAPMPSTYPVAQRLPGRISSMLLSAFSIAMLPPVQEFAIWLCDCKAREALSMLPFTEDTFGTPTPDVFERVHLANPPWESTGFKSDVFLPAKMVTRVLEWCSVQSWSAIVAAKSFSWSKEVHSSSLAVDTAGSVFGHKEFSWHDYAHDEDDFSVPARMHHFEDGKCLYIIDREGSPGDKSLFLSAPQYVAKFTDAPSYTMRGQDLLDYFFTVLQAIIALVKKVSSGKSKYDCDARKRARKEKDGLRSKAKPVRDKILISPEYINDKGWRHYYDDASIISVLKAMKAGVLPEASWFSPHVLFCATGNWNIAIAATICQFEVFRIMLVLNQEVTVVGLRSETLLACAKAAPSLDAAAFVDLSEADILVLSVLASARLTKQGKGGGLADFAAEAEKGGIAGKLYYKACDDMRALAGPFRGRIYAVMHRLGVGGVPATPGSWTHSDITDRTAKDRRKCPAIAPARSLRAPAPPSRARSAAPE